MLKHEGAKSTYRVDLQPVGRRAEIQAGETLLDAARAAGVELVSLCGGDGWCHQCVVRLREGRLSAITENERDAFTEEQLAAGYRLACQAEPMSDVKVEIPPESLTTQQRLQMEGQETAIAPHPAVTPLEVVMSAPSLHDLRSDALRLTDAVIEQDLEPPALAHAVLRQLSTKLRDLDWSVRLAVYRNAHDGREAVALLPSGKALLGLAVDVGTTKVASYLVDLATGHTLAKAGAMNPQISYGEDVISRIGYCIEHADGRDVLQGRLVETLNQLVASLCAEVGVEREQIADAVVVGNTAMHHLFAGLPVEQLGRAPYVPAVSEPLDIRASDIGLELAPAAHVHLPSNIAGYVGADHVAMALATRAWETDKTLVALDIGTNTEVTVAKGGRAWCCSCASGPAFEGAHIRDGMRAAPGAIERVQILDGEVHLKTIGDVPPVGICGSGILDAVNALLQSGVINRSGGMKDGLPHVSRQGNLALFTLAPSDITGHGRPVMVSRKDINEIQLAKAAIRVGLDVLLAEAGASYDEIEDFIVAGAFGTYIDIGSAVGVGMFPPLRPERFRQVGNAAGAGAREMLVSLARRRIAAELARNVSYVELTIYPGFADRFMKALYFAPNPDEP